MALVDLKGRFQEILQRIEAAARGSGRDPSEVRLLAVSKTFPAQAVQSLAGLGQLDFGENYVQEAQQKIEQVRLPQLHWHLIGHLQSNKSLAAAKLFGTVHSLDRLSLAQRLDKAALAQRRRIKCFVQVHLGPEESKSGILPENLQKELSSWPTFEFLELVGLMCIPPAQDSRRYFAQLRELAAQLHQSGLLSGQQLSMGMSDDFEAAISEGSHWIRIGRALFGER